jgi:hypothetical protein
MTQTAAGGGSVVAFQPGAGVSFSQAFAGRNIPKKNFIERGARCSS